jgi:hypothetical protein
MCVQYFAKAFMESKGLFGLRFKNMRFEQEIFKNAAKLLCFEIVDFYVFKL